MSGTDPTLDWSHCEDPQWVHTLHSYRDFVASLQDIFGCELVGGCIISDRLNHFVTHHGLVLNQTQSLRIHIQYSVYGYQMSDFQLCRHTNIKRSPRLRCCGGRWTCHRCRSRRCRWVLWLRQSERLTPSCWLPVPPHQCAFSFPEWSAHCGCWTRLETPWHGMKDWERASVWGGGDTTVTTQRINFV